MTAVTQRLTDSSLAGGWWVFARPKGLPVADITFLRGYPVLAGEFSFSDPFGPKEMTLTFPQVSVFDRIGEGDLYWLRKKVSVDVIWHGLTPLPAAYPFGNIAHLKHLSTGLGVPYPSMSWEGYITGFSFSGGALSVTLKGALYQLDDYLAKPEFITRPIPYEHAIARQFLDKPHLRLGLMHMIWPDNWATKYAPPPKATPSYLIPAGVKKGQNWTRLLTRSTGSWEATLTSYIQTLLNAMYTRHGRFTLDLQTGRIPVLLHRTMRTDPDASTAVLDAVSDAVDISGLEIDWSQSLDVAYAQGTSLAGVAYSGQEISPDGQRTTYEPLAALRQAYPADDNEWLDLAEMPREVLLQMQPGLDEYNASRIALAHLERFGDPGVTGSLTVTGDVQLGTGSDAPTIPHHLVRAGMTVQVRNLLGHRDGILVHVTDSSTSISEGKTTLTVDSKYRDALTVEEVRNRGRDAMAISRMLVAGQYTPPLPDQLLPWNYAAGSGMIPSAPYNSSVELFDSMPDSTRFPWTDWTKSHPPKSGRWRHCYIEIPASSSNADKNWSGVPKAGGQRFGIGVRMSQAGSIRLFQMAAYDRDGNVMRVPFHVSFYYTAGVNVGSMPLIPPYNNDPSSPGYYPYHHPPYDVHQHYPFVVNAFETYNLDGTEHSTEVPQPVGTAGLWLAYGTSAVKAGYWPGDGLSGDPTGLLVDETVRPFSTVQYGQFDVHARKQRTAVGDAGWVYVMVYCDAQGTQPVYFLGRMFRLEPGTQGGQG